MIKVEILRIKNYGSFDIKFSRSEVEGSRVMYPGKRPIESWIGFTYWASYLIELKLFNMKEMSL